MLVANWTNQTGTGTHPESETFGKGNWQGFLFALINDAARSFFNQPNERQKKGDMKQLTVHDHVKHMELLKHCRAEEVENALISNFKTEGKGLFLHSRDRNPETWGLPSDEENSSRRQGLLTKEQPD